jgi:hypothetical protein
LPWLYWTSYTFDTPFDYANDGAHTVLYQSVDRLAQVEAPRRRLVKIDTRPPANPNAVGPAEVNGYIGPNPTFRWTSQDWGSSKLIREETAIAAVDVVGDRAYALDGTLLRVLDLFNPETPQELGRVDLGAIGPVDVTVVGDYAYVVAQVFGLIVVDVSDPAHPVAVGGRTIRGEPTHVAVTNRFAFVTTNEGVALVALEKPTAPLQVGLIELRSVNDVAADGDALAVLAADSLVTFDVSRPASYREVGSFSFKAWPTAVSVHRDVACVAWAGGASAMSVPLEAAPSLISNLTVSGPFVDIVFTGTMATLLAPDAGAVQIDLGEPDQPIYVGWTWSVGGRTTALDATPEYIFIAEGPGGLSVAKAMQTEAASVEFDDTATTEPDFDPDGGVVSRVSYAGVDGGQKYFHVRVRDQAGNWSGTTHLAVNVDAGGPTIANNADAAWHRSFTFTASAADSQSGLASLELAVDGGPWQSVSSITLRTWTKRGGGSGVHTVICRATDRVGNAVARPAAVYLDGRAPQTTDDAPKDPADRWNPPPQPAPVTVTLSATDAHSGVARTLYSLDGRAWTEGTSVLVPAAADGSDDGLHWIGYYSEDAVGNVEYSHWVPVVIDVPSAPAVRGILRGLRR